MLKRAIQGSGRALKVMRINERQGRKIGNCDIRKWNCLVKQMNSNGTNEEQIEMELVWVGGVVRGGECLVSCHVKKWWEGKTERLDKIPLVKLVIIVDQRLPARPTLQRLPQCPSGGVPKCASMVIVWMQNAKRHQISLLMGKCLFMMALITAFQNATGCCPWVAYLVSTKTAKNNLSSTMTMR